MWTSGASARQEADKSGLGLKKPKLLPAPAPTSDVIPSSAYPARLAVHPPSIMTRTRQLPAATPSTPYHPYDLIRPLLHVSFRSSLPSLPPSHQQNDAQRHEKAYDRQKSTIGFDIDGRAPWAGWEVRNTHLSSHSRAIGSCRLGHSSIHASQTARARRRLSETRRVHPPHSSYRAYRPVSPGDRSRLTSAGAVCIYPRNFEVVVGRVRPAP